MNFKVRQLLTDVLEELNVVSFGQSPRPEDLILCLRKFNDFVDDLSADKLALFHQKRVTFPIVNGTGSYTIGDGGDWDDTRPQEITRAGFVPTATTPSSTIELPVRILTDDEWASEAIKALESTIVIRVWYEQTSPLGTVHVWPVPTTGGDMVLYYKDEIGEVSVNTAGFETELMLPKGWKRMLVTNLAVDVASAFEKEPSATLVAKAFSTMTRIKRANIRYDVLRLPSGLPGVKRRGRFNLITNGLKG